MSKRKLPTKPSPLTRRGFLKAAGAAGVAYWLGPKLMIGGKAYAQIPGGTLLPGAVSQYATPLLIPPVMPLAGKIGNIDYYEIAVRQFQQQILPPMDINGRPTLLPKTTVWGYGSKVGGKSAIFNAPSLTIEARQGRPVRIKWINELVADGNYLPHLLPVDPTLHWANPPQGSQPDLYGKGGRDERPTFSTTPGRYTGPVPMVTHVHGAVGVGDESDGYAEAWYLPAANNLPAGYARVGTWYDDFKTKAKQKFGVTWGPGYAVFQYPNANRASTIWYHDHTLGMTRLNVYAGPAGFYIVRGGPAGDDAVLNSRTNTVAKLPGPAPQSGDAAGTKYYEIPIAIQDRSFNNDGSLFYPDSRAFFDDGITGPYIPGSDLSPIWNPEFFGNMIMVNGNTWPYLEVEKRRYRFRFLNGCQARFLILDFSNIPGVEVWQIGNEGGFLAAPVNMTAVNGNQILMSPAERADVIVDFTNVQVSAAGTGYVLRNVGPDEPYNGRGQDAADPDTTGQIMQFRVVPRVGYDRTTPPAQLTLPPITPLPVATVTRPVALLEELSKNFADAPAEVLLGTVTVDPNINGGLPTCNPYMWSDEVTENVNLGDTEVWEFYNTTADAHPMHIHEVAFEVVNRQEITVDETTKTVQVKSGSQPEDPKRWETGFKDTVIAYPDQVTRVKATFATPGQFVWHCHIVEHEDNEMMRPYSIDDTAGFPRTPVLDSFPNNGPIGSSWRGDVANYRVSNNQATPLGTGAIFWNPTSFGPNQEAYFTFNSVSGTTKEQDLILKLTGGAPTAATAQMIEIWCDVRHAVVKILTRDQVNGWVRRATFNGVTFAARDQLGARALADGKVIVFKNGEPIGSTYVTKGGKPWPANLVKGGGNIGVWFIQNNAGAPLAASFDNFGGGNI